MNFKIVFRGYDKEEVEKYLKETEQRYSETLAAQKERIIDLSDENGLLREQVRQYKVDEQAISKSLVESQKLAAEMRGDAEKFAQLTLSRAKIFYATWQAYAKTLAASLSDNEIRQFNALSKKIEDVINAYEGKDVAAATAVHIETVEKISRDRDEAEKAVINGNAMPTERTVNEARRAEADGLVNPVTKVEKAAGQAIDLRELTRTEESLEELCADLGLIGRQSKK